MPLYDQFPGGPPGDCHREPLAKPTITKEVVVIDEKLLIEIVIRVKYSL